MDYRFFTLQSGIDSRDLVKLSKLALTRGDACPKCPGVRWNAENTLWLGKTDSLFSQDNGKRTLDPQP